MYDPDTYYLEYIAKVEREGLSAVKQEIYDEDSGDFITVIENLEGFDKNDVRTGIGNLCDMSYVYGETFVKQYIKKVYCGREWCPRCGENNSEYHKRRMSRWWHKVNVIYEMGYLVITLPLEVRDSFKDTNTLKKFRKYLTVKLKKHGIHRGLSRWHWGGEQWGVWNPHLNFLFEGGYIDLGILMQWREDIRKWFHQKCGIPVEVVNINYRFSSEIPLKIHWLKYVTRSTLKWYDDELAPLLKGFRTTSSWGKWDDAKQGEIDQDELDEFLREIEKEYSIELYEREMREKESAGSEENDDEQKMDKKQEKENTEKEKGETEIMEEKQEKTEVFDPFKDMEKMKPMTKEDIAEIAAIAQLQKGKCPYGTGKINWLGFRRGKIPETYKHIGGGYYVNTGPRVQPPFKERIKNPKQWRQGKLFEEKRQ